MRLARVLCALFHRPVKVEDDLLGAHWCERCRTYRWLKGDMK